MAMSEEQLKLGNLDAAVDICREGIRRTAYAPSLLSKLGILYLRRVYVRSVSHETDWTIERAIEKRLTKR